MRLLPALILALALSACNASPAPERGAIPLRIATPNGTLSLTVEVAVTEAEQERGLMHRTSLPHGHGMLFPFTLPRTANFWMKDTPFPLDLLFVAPDGTVTAVLHGKADDLHPLSTGEPVSAVVEIGAGEAQRLGITVGARVEWGDCHAATQGPGLPINPRAFCPAAP